MTLTTVACILIGLNLGLMPFRHIAALLFAGVLVLLALSGTLGFLVAAVVLEALVYVTWRMRRNLGRDERFATRTA